MLLFLYLTLGVFLFTEEHILLILSIKRQKRFYTALFLMLDLLYLFLFYPLEIIVNNYGGQKSLNTLITVLFSPLAFVVFVVMIIELYIITFVKYIKNK